MDRLEQLYRSFIEAVLPSVVQAYSLRPVFRPEVVITHGDNNSIQTSFRAQPDYTEVIFSLRDTLPQLNQAYGLMNYIKATPSIAADLFVDGAGNSLPDDPAIFFNFHVWPFLRAYLSEIPTLESSLNETVFENAMTNLKAYLESPQLSLIYEAPIIGLKTDVDRIDFSNDIWIRRRTDDDIKRVSLPYQDFDPTRNEVSFNSHFLVIRTFQDKHGPFGGGPAYQIAAEVISAFRLFKSGPIGLGAARQTTELNVGSMVGSMLTPSSGIIAGDYSLEPDEINKVKPLFEKCRTNQDVRWLLALRRLNLTYERKIDEDRLLDCWVGLEALLLPDGKQGELKYRVVLRLARFLGATKAERLQLKGKTKTSYDRRSDVIHGTTPLKSDMPNVTEETVSLLRRILIRWLDGRRSHDIDSIDDSLLS